MKTDVVVSNQHHQLGVSGVSEHPVEATHVVLPVLHTNKTHRELRPRKSVKCKKKKKELKMTVFLYGLWCRRAEVWVSFLFLVYFSS